VSRVFHGLEGEFAAWKQRALEARYVYAFTDGTYFSVIYQNEGHKMPILASVGINGRGEREVLGFTVGERENQAAWEDLLEDLKRRGVQEVDLWVTDGNQAMLNALQLKFLASQWQRCIKHKMENVMGYVPTTQQEVIQPELKAIFYQDSREKADQEVAAFIAKYSTPLSDRSRVPEARPGHQSDLLRSPSGALENDPLEQRDRAALRRGEGAQPQDGHRLSQRRQLSVNVLRGDPRADVQENLDTSQRTRLPAITQNLTYCPLEIHLPSPAAGQHQPRGQAEGCLSVVSGSTGTVAMKTAAVPRQQQEPRRARLTRNETVWYNLHAGVAPSSWA